MAVLRQLNVRGEQRIDVPHLRLIESAVAGDFDLLAGRVIAGKVPVVVRGFRVATAGVINAEQLSLVVADGVLLHFMASESGSMFFVPADRDVEVLNPVTNTRVIGAFTPSTVNYVGVDLVRSADPSTVDQVMFWTSTGVERPEEQALGNTLDYRIYISTTDFDSTPGVLPIAKVTTGASNAVVSVEDARNGMWRLASGGSLPNAKGPYAWPEGRKEGSLGNGFSGGDKAIGSMKEWADAMMSRTWELGGGEFWYSATADRNVKLTRGGSLFTNGEHFEWDGTNLHWQGLTLVLSNCTGLYNAIANQTVDSVGLTDLGDGDCIYVDIDATTNRIGGAALVPAKAALATLGSPTVPGSRWILAWNRSGLIYTRDQAWAVGTSFAPATITALGVVKVSATELYTPLVPRTPLCDSANGCAIAAGVTRGGNNGGTSPTTFYLGAGDVQVGGGTNDHNVNVATARSQDQTTISGSQNYVADGTAVLVVQDNHDSGSSSPSDRILELKDANQVVATFEACGAIGMVPTLATPATPAPVAGNYVRAKFHLRTNGVGTPHTRDQLAVMWHDGSITVVAEGPEY